MNLTIYGYKSITLIDKFSPFSEFVQRYTKIMFLFNDGFLSNAKSVISTFIECNSLVKENIFLHVLIVNTEY